MKYEEALKHIGECMYADVACPFKCGKILIKAELETHFKECPNYFETCNKCGLQIRQDERKSHDCVQALK
jgi:hypothetical protein